MYARYYLILNISIENWKSALIYLLIKANFNKKFILSLYLIKRKYIVI